MEIVGGFMVMMSIIGFFLAAVWLVMPFVVFAIKGRQDRTLEVLEAMEKRLTAIEACLQSAGHERNCVGSSEKYNHSAESSSESSGESSVEHESKSAVMHPEAVAEKGVSVAPPAV